MAIEGTIFALSIYLVWSLYMPLKTKAVVVGAFFCRILYAPLSLGIYVVQLTPTPASSSPQSSACVSSAPFSTIQI